MDKMHIGEKLGKVQFFSFFPLWNVDGNHTRCCSADSRHFFSLLFSQTSLLTWRRSEWKIVYMCVSDKSSLIFQTCRRKSFNEDYRQIAVVTSGWKRGGAKQGVEAWSSTLLLPREDFSSGTDTTFNNSGSGAQIRYPFPLCYFNSQCISYYFNLLWKRLKVFSSRQTFLLFSSSPIWFVLHFSALSWLAPI